MTAGAVTAVQWALLWPGGFAFVSILCAPVNVLLPGIIPMQMQAIYPNYGLHGGESSTSCVGLLAQVMNVDDYGQQKSSQSYFYSAQTD